MAQRFGGRAATAQPTGAEDGADIARLAAERISSLPAGQQLEERGARFVLWLDESGRKVPYRTNGLPADTTKPSTWSTLDECEKALGRIAATGIGLVLAAERDAVAGWAPIVGIDLDGCRNPETGEIEPWALEIIRAFASYAEVSPSGTGVKIYCFVDPVPTLAANKLVLGKANGAGKAPAIEVYVTARYFALTGDHLDGTPDELVDATEAFERLAARIAREARKRSGDRADPQADGRGTPSAATLRLLEDDPTLAALWRGGERSGDTTASGMDWSLARELGRREVPAEEIARVLRAYPHGQIGGGKLKGRQERRRLAQLLDEAQRVAESRGGNEPDLPLVRIQQGELDRIVDEAQAVLGVATCRVFQDGGQLARVERVTKDLEHREQVIPAGTLEIIPCTVTWLTLELSRLARFERVVGVGRDGPEWGLCDPPQKVAATVLEDMSGWKVPVLTGTSEVPILHPDGGVRNEPGHDARSGLYLDPGPARFPAIPPAPTQADAAAALDALKAPPSEFPFVEPHHRSAALAMVLTAVVRRQLPSAPMFGVSAREAGTGKGLLVDVAAIVATGRRAPVTPFSEAEEEARKHITAALAAGRAVLAIDNVTGILESAALCALLTASSWSDRLLGANRMVTLPANVLAVATGNNMRGAGGMNRRVPPIELDAGVERPELRSFGRGDLPSWLLEHRPRLVAAAITVLAAHRRAGCPVPPDFTPLGSYEAWSRQVAGALVWLGEDDPLRAMDDLRRGGPKRGALPPGGDR